MIMSQEQALLKAHEQFHQLLDSVRQAADHAQRTDLVERDIRLRLLGIGLTVLTSFIARHGDGDSGPTVGTPDGRTLRRLPEPHDRRYVSIFGELLIPRVVYGTREGQEIESVPLDCALGLPEGEFSYVLEDWVQRFCLKESFTEASRSLETLLGLRLYSRTLEHMNRVVAESATPFRETIGPPPAEEEGPLLEAAHDRADDPPRLLAALDSQALGHLPLPLGRRQAPHERPNSRLLAGCNVSCRICGLPSARVRTFTNTCSPPPSSAFV